MADENEGEETEVDLDEGELEVEDDDEEFGDDDEVVAVVGIDEDDDDAVVDADAVVAEEDDEGDDAAPRTTRKRPGGEEEEEEDDEDPDDVEADLDTILKDKIASGDDLDDEDQSTRTSDSGVLPHHSYLLRGTYPTSALGSTALV